MKTFRDEFTIHCQAGFGGVYVESCEQQETIRTINEVAEEHDWGIKVWTPASDDPIDTFLKGLSFNPNNDRRELVVLFNIERYVNEFPEAAQAVQTAIVHAKQSRANIVAVCSTTKLPASLERMFAHVEHTLPDANEIAGILDDLQWNCTDREAVVRAASGLTRTEAEDAFSLSYVRNDQHDVLANDVWQTKAKQIKATGCLEIYEGESSFDSLCGLDELKRFCASSVGHPDAKGVLLLGVPGAGKSEFAKALGKQTGYPTVIWDIGAMMGSLVGQTEQRMRRALQTIDRIAPCILFVDEIEKALGGASNSNDSGVSQRIFGTLLTWLNDRTSSVYFIGTCNDIEKLTNVSSGAFVRAERFDGLFYIGLPSEAQRDAMWQMYCDKYGVDFEGEFDDSGWTGAEIKSACRLAHMQGITIEQAARMVIPVNDTASDQLGALESWAHERCIDANKGGRYTSPRHVASRKRVV